MCQPVPYLRTGHYYLDDKSDILVFEEVSNWSVLDNEFHNITLNGTIVVIAYTKTDT